MNRFSGLVFAVIAGSAMLFSASSRADQISYSVSGSDKDGEPVSAKVDLSLGAHGALTITLTNLINAVTSAGQAISSLQILFNDSSVTSTKLTSLSGTLDKLTQKKHQPVVATADPAPTPRNTHWSTALSYDWFHDQKTLWLATAGPGAKGGSPQDMIIGDSYANVNSSLLNRTHNNVFIGNATFNLTVKGLTSLAQISSIAVGFGSCPKFITARVAEPGTLALVVGSGLFGFIGLTRRRRGRAEKRVA